MTLNSKEFELLTRIAEQSKMDCWFCIKQTKKGEDYVYDLENGKRMSLRTGIYQLMEGIEDMYDEYFEEQDYETMILLLLKFM
jgi:hypothetical protein